MFKKVVVAATFTTMYLIVYVVMLNITVLLPYAELMLLLSPVVMVWTIYTVLKFDRYNNTELDSEEFGYQDKRKIDLGKF